MGPKGPILRGMLRLFATSAVLAAAASVVGCAEGCPIVCGPHGCTGCPDTRSSAPTDPDQTGADEDHTAMPCPVGAPFGPCDAGTCAGADGVNAWCLHGALGDVCVPTCMTECPVLFCQLPGTCDAGACIPTCDDWCPAGMVCDASVGACVFPK